MQLVRGAVRHYCLGGCSALGVCERRSRAIRGGLGPVPGIVSSPFPPCRPAFPALCVAGRPVGVSPILARWYAIPCGLCVPRARSGCPSGLPRVSFVCVCARALAASTPPMVGPFHAVSSPPRVLPGSRAPFGLLLGGCGLVPFTATWLGAARSPWGGCGPGDPAPTPTRALLRACFARCGDGTRAPREGRLLPRCGASGVWRSPTPNHSSFRACGRGPLPTGCGCGRCGRGDPSATPPRALL